MSMKKSKRFTPAFLLRDSAVSHREPSAELRFARANRRCSFYSLCAKKKEGVTFLFWRRERDSNPRTVARNTISSRARSTTPPSLRFKYYYESGRTRCVRRIEALCAYHSAISAFNACLFYTKTA